MKELKSFETERLLLKPSSEEDAAFFLEILNTPKWLKFIGDRKVRTIEDALVYIESRLKEPFQRNGFGNYTIIRKADGIKIGSCGLYDRAGVDGVDIGLAFLPQYEKKGYALESSSKLKEISFSEFGLKEISAVTDKDNFDSQKLLKKMGFQFERYIILPGEKEEILLYKYIHGNEKPD